MATCWLLETFERSEVDPRLRWSCPPPVWRVEPDRGVLHVEPAARTDFWRKTHYGFEADNGHFFHAELAGDFVLTTHVRSRPVHQYDQAGLMVRVSPTCWLKTSVEFEPHSANRLGAVVTNHGYSDWSTQDAPPSRDELGLRVRREGDDCIVEWAPDGRALQWTQIRMAHLHEACADRPLQCGVYACSPKGRGMWADFRMLQIEQGRIQSNETGI